MNQNLTGSNVLVNIAQCRIYYLCGYVIDIISVNQIKNQPTLPPCNEIFRVILRCGAARIAQRAPMIRVFAGVNNKPPALTSNSGFVRLRANKQIMMNFYNAFPPLMPSFAVATSKYYKA
jgi:hypothetical protein